MSELTVHENNFLETSGGLELPVIITNAGEHAARRFIEFFVVTIRNKNTRMAYARAVYRFMDWCDERGLGLLTIEPIAVAAYVEHMQADYEVPTVKQHLAAIRMLFDWMVTGQVLPSNPAASVRGPRHVVETGKTPIMAPDEARQLLESIETHSVVGLRDRALIAVMLYTFGRVSAVTQIKVEDYYMSGKQARIRLQEKGGKVRELPLHHKAVEYLDAYIQIAGISDEKKLPLFRSTGRGRGARVTERPLDRRNVLDMIKRRAIVAGLSSTLCSHSMRGTGITTFLEADGKLEVAQAIAGHASARTTKLYDRRNQNVQQGEIERIRF